MPLPDCLRMYSCRSLELENNKIALLPREISRLTCLTHLNVKHNKLVTLPYTLCLLKQLVCIILFPPANYIRFPPANSL